MQLLSIARLFALTKDGFNYFSESEVLSLLSKASATDPEASRGDEGESLEYAFALLKSHLAITQSAIASNSAVVFNRFN